MFSTDLIEMFYVEISEVWVVDSKWFSCYQKYEQKVLLFFNWTI